MLSNIKFRIIAIILAGLIGGLAGHVFGFYGLLITLPSAYVLDIMGASADSNPY